MNLRRDVAAAAIAVLLSSCGTPPAAPDSAELDALRIKAAGAESTERENATLRRKIVDLETQLRSCGQTPATEQFSPVSPPTPAPASVAPRPQAPTVILPVVVKAEAKATETNQSWTRFSWNVTVQNPSDAPMSVYVGVEFLDSGGFVVEDNNLNPAMLGPGESVTVRGYELITAAVAPSVASVRGTVKRR